MKNICKIGACLSFIMAAAFFAAAYKEEKPYRAAKENHVQLKNLVFCTADEEDAGSRNIDFDLLQGINPEIAAWVYIPNTSIDYPVLIGETDTFYLNRDYKKSYNPLGAIFAFSDTDRGMADAHICLFGHNMKEPQMFGELKRYLEDEYAKEHEILYLYMPNRTEIYQLCSGFVCEKTDEIFRHKMQSESKEMEKCTERIMEKNTISAVTCKEGEKIEKILTLTACSDEQRTKMRTTIHFRKIENEEG